MRTREFNKLTDGQRVIVTGAMDGKVFGNEPGVVELNVTPSVTVTVKFDRDISGWGDGERCWGFEAAKARNFNITPEPVKPAEPVKPEVAKKRPHGKQEYKGNGNHYWERVAEATYRLRVPGGWLYGTKVDGISTGARVRDTTFVPVPQAVGYAV